MTGGLLLDASVVLASTHHVGWIAANAVSKLLLLGLVMVEIMGHVRREQRVTLDLVLGACSVYFLLAVAWAIGFSLLTLAEPTAFSGLDTAAAGGHLAELMYYSLVTLTTLGYGDIAPQMWLSRNLAALEAFTGQLYVAITIAYLVGMGISSRMEKAAAADE